MVETFSTYQQLHVHQNSPPSSPNPPLLGSDEPAPLGSLEPFSPGSLEPSLHGQYLYSALIQAVKPLSPPVEYNLTAFNE